MAVRASGGRGGGDDHQRWLMANPFLNYYGQILSKKNLGFVPVATIRSNIKKFELAASKRIEYTIRPRK